MFYYKILDLPQPPQELIDSVELNRKPDEMELGVYHQRHLKNWYGHDFKAAVNIRTKHEAFDKWVRENITDNFVDAGVNYTLVDLQGLDKISTGGHVDVIRKYTLLYNLQTGGPDATTTWWQETGKEVVRPPKTQAEDQSRLTPLEQVIIPTGVWALVYTQVIHSVENLIEPRVSFQVSLNDISSLIDK